MFFGKLLERVIISRYQQWLLEIDDFIRLKFRETPGANDFAVDETNSLRWCETMRAKNRCCFVFQSYRHTQTHARVIVARVLLCRHVGLFVLTWLVAAADIREAQLLLHLENRSSLRTGHFQMYRDTILKILLLQDSDQKTIHCRI
jgi:hypothetical protein